MTCGQHPLLNLQCSGISPCNPEETLVTEISHAFSYHMVSGQASNKGCKEVRAMVRALL
jgi:hypothetical protein